MSEPRSANRSGQRLGARPVGGPCTWRPAGSARQCAFNEARSDSPLPFLIVGAPAGTSLPERIAGYCGMSSLAGLATVIPA